MQAAKTNRNERKYFDIGEIAEIKWGFIIGGADSAV